MPVNLKKSCTSVPHYTHPMLENYPQETIKTLEEYSNFLVMREERDRKRN